MAVEYTTGMDHHQKNRRPQNRGTALPAWNAMGRIATVTPYGGTATSYVYDGDGQRVEDTASQSLYWYGPDGKLVGETDGGDVNIQWIYFDGRKISKFNMSPEGPWGAEFYDNADGSLLLETDGYGNTNCRANYYPFGEPVGADCQAYESFQYAGLYADKSGEVGDDSAAHRQLNDIYYRWLSPDPAGMSAVNLTNPQTWNMYAYALNNPTTLNDPSGMAANGCGKESPQVCTQLTASGQPRTDTAHTVYERALHQVVVESTTTKTAKGANGKMRTTTVSTLAIFSTREGHGGEFIAGERFTGSGASQTELNASQAELALGSSTFNSAIAQSAAASAPGFFTITGRDMEAHPYGYILAAAQIGITPALPEAVAIPLRLIGIGIHGTQVAKDLPRLFEAYGW